MHTLAVESRITVLTWSCLPHSVPSASPIVPPHSRCNHLQHSIMSNDFVRSGTMCTDDNYRELIIMSGTASRTNLIAAVALRRSRPVGTRDLQREDQTGGRSRYVPKHPLQNHSVERRLRIPTHPHYSMERSLRHRTHPLRGRHSSLVRWSSLRSSFVFSCDLDPQGLLR